MSKVPDGTAVCCCGHIMDDHLKSQFANLNCQVEGCPCMDAIGVGSKMAHEAMAFYRVWRQTGAQIHFICMPPTNEELSV